MRGRGDLLACALPALTALMALTALGAEGARAERFAVLPVDAARDGGELPVKAAAALRAALMRQGIDVLDETATRGVLERHLQSGGATLASYQNRMQQAEQALAALEQERSLAILRELIANLADDPDFSTEKQALLEAARLKLASRLIGLAGSRETGNAETPGGRQARALLVDALRANPKLSPSRDEYPPRFHSALDGARAELNRLGTGGLSVDSRPRGATVFVEGRNIGQTPLVLGDDVLPKGAYRMWVEASGARSVPQLVHIEDSAPQLFIDLAFEGSLWADGPGLRPLVGGVIDEDVAKKIGGFLKVDTLLLVGRWSYEGAGDYLWGAAFAVEEGAKERHGVVRLDSEQGLEAAAVGLASFLGRGERQGVESRPLPPTVLPDRHASAGGVARSSPSLSVTMTQLEDFPWVPVGIAGAVLAVAVAGGVTAAVLLSRPSDALVLKVEELR
jgi:hypothetical protein